MAAITTRQTAGAGATVAGVPLTNAQLDNNFININTELGQKYDSTTSRTANTFLAAPSGAAGAATFRAIVAADIPTLNQNTTGSAASISGALPSNLTIATTSPVLILRDTDNSGTGVGQTGWISFQDSTSTERGWIGYGSSGSTDLNISNSRGNITIGGSIAVTASNIGTYALPIGGGTLTGQLTVPANFTVQAEGSGEGGQIILKKGTSQVNLAGDVILDTLGDSFRIFENGGGFRQIFFNLTNGNITGSGGINPNISGNAATVTNGVYLSGAQTLSDKTLTSAILTAYSETVNTATVSTTTYNIDLSLGNIFYLTLASNVTFTFTNPAPAGRSRPVTVILQQDATGGRTATFTGARYTEGQLPQLSTGANQIDMLSFFSTNGGSWYFGTFAMANVS